MMPLKSLLVTVILLLGLTMIAQGYICSNPKSYVGKTVCDPWGRLCGQCVSFVKTCTDDRRRTEDWSKGEKVRDAIYIPFGTAIATFPNGVYNGHAAIYVSHDSNGIQVYDQWRGSPVAYRTIRWNGRNLVNNGDSYYVID